MKHLKVNRTELTPVSFLVRSAYVFPDKVAVVHGSRRYTYRQLAERVNRLASALRTLGLQKHDRVAFICPNIPPMLEAHYGVPVAGGILVAINTRLSSDEIGYILQHSGSKFLFVDAELEGLVKPLELGNIKVVRVDDTGLTGRFDIDLTWDQAGLQGQAPDALKQALLEELGLELTPAKQPIDMLVVQQSR
jgi:fatty-acyl-CoA synthase